jgi:ParB family chromosome partitioning protein
VKQKRLNKTAPVPCIVSEATSKVLVDEISLAENIERAPLHPLDQFRAFRAMREKGMTEEAIAAAFFVGVNVVKQRLRLVAVSSNLLDVYADDGMTLEQLMAFTVSPDHERQEQVWDAVRNGWQKEPYHIRRMLTESAVRASDKRALFVGVDAYEAAGGVVLRDLFQSDDGGWLQDVALLDRLASEKLKATAQEVAAEGWKWIEAAINLPYGVTYGLRQLSGAPADLSDDERTAVDALKTERDQLEAQYEAADEMPEDADRRLGEIEAELEKFDRRPLRYDEAEIARAGAFVSIGANGSLVVERGYVRPDDEAPEPTEQVAAEASDVATGALASDPASQPAVVVVNGEVAPTEDEEDEGIKPLPDRLVAELTAHRTLALRDALANHPHVAMTALLHKLVSDNFLHPAAPGCLEASVRHIYFPAQTEDLKDCASAKAIDDRRLNWGDHIPAGDEDLWNWLTALDEGNRMALLAHCVSYGVNALHEKANPYSGAGVSEQGLKLRLTQADRLAQATGLDMVEAGWRPTVGNYLGRVTKARILEAVREGAGDKAVQLIGHLKKGDMAKEAERLLADTGWLPEPLRMSGADGTNAAEPTTNAEGEDHGDLPAFLAEDDEGATEDEDAASLAAE